MSETPRGHTAEAVPMLSTDESRRDVAEMIMDKLYEQYVGNAQLPEGTALAYLYECCNIAWGVGDDFDFKIDNGTITFTLNNGEHVVTLDRSGRIVSAESDNVHNIGGDQGGEL